MKFKKGDIIAVLKSGTNGADVVIGDIGIIISASKVTSAYWTTITSSSPNINWWLGENSIEKLSNLSPLEKVIWNIK